MIKKAISAIMAIPVAIGFCTVGYKGKEPSCDHITERCSYVYTTKAETKEYLGKFRLTYYTPYEEGGKWGYETATGVKSQHLKTCAVDPSVIPLGSTIEITGKNGKKLVLKAVDIGGLVKGRSIDIFIDNPSHKECNAFMEQFGEIRDVYLIK